MIDHKREIVVHVSQPEDRIHPPYDIRFCVSPVRSKKLSVTAAKSLEAPSSSIGSSESAIFSPAETRLNLRNAEFDRSDRADDAAPQRLDRMRQPQDIRIGVESLHV